MGMGIGSDMADIRSVPVIWPTSKEKVKQTQSAEESQQSSRQVSSAKSQPQQAASIAEAAQAQQAAQAAKEQAPPPPETRSMSISDLVQYLIQAKIPNTEENKFMASLMMQHGVELSPDNFNSLFKLTKGDKNANTLESAVINLTKGLDTPKGVDILGNFLKDNPQLQAQMVQANKSLAELQKSLNSTQKLLDPSLMAGLISLLSDMDEEFKKLLKNAQEGSKAALPELKRGSFMKDLSLLSQFLNGVEQKLAENNQLNSPEGKDLQQKLASLKTGLNGLTENLISQVILSKESNRNISSVNDKYLYWQLPNPFDKNGQLELGIKRDTAKEKGEIDPSKTRILLKVNTPELGEITIIIDVLGQKIWYIFNTENEEVNSFIKKMHSDLLKQMEALNYRVSGFQAIKKKIDLKKIIVPTFSLDNLVRISTEV